MRMGTLASIAARAISPTLSSNWRMLPGLTRTAAQPASIAANTYLGWKWMSAMTGICDLRAMVASASASSWDGTATRTIWQPAAVSSAICWRVELTSEVSVVVIDCTETGAPPPTGTDPTMICRLCRRGASGAGGAVGMPRLIAVTMGSLTDVDWVDHVGQDRQQREAAEDHDHHVGDGHQLVVVDATGVGLAPLGREPRAHPLVPGDRDVAAVQRQQRQQVEHADEEVQLGRDDQEQVPGVQRRRLAAD